MNSEILYSLLVIGLVAAAVGGATWAYFSDTETSTGNTFTAGKLDLKVDAECHYNGLTCENDQHNIWVGGTQYPAGLPCYCRWDLKDLTSEKFFDLQDVKPGDYGEDTISLHVYDNPAWACMTVTPVKNDDMSSIEPELKAGDNLENASNLFDGELAQNLQGMIWADVCSKTAQYPNALPGDNIYQPDCDKKIGTGIAPLQTVTLPLADNKTNVFTGTAGPLQNSTTYYIGISWTLPGATGNIVQSDSYVADFSFYTEQYRNNLGFVCRP